MTFVTITLITTYLFTGLMLGRWVLVQLESNSLAASLRVVLLLAMTAFWAPLIMWYATRELYGFIGSKNTA